MKKIDQEVYTAVKNWRHFRRTGTGETEVTVASMSKNKGREMVHVLSVSLHGNIIFRMSVNETTHEMRVVRENCGWNTQTTVQRMKAALAATSVGVSVRLHHGKIEFTDGDNVWLERFDSAWLRR